ncbi:type I glutamate--ammonia ligase [Alkaliphilus serpentinus]|uniref:glutamine synthetase n=1 Tax=Alkaliphilus serpentinus TaxID=1482731 RepID=A0A833HQC2_9FIRM|nr:type I glutamate--ammonia ligase [Alkaliphilus serpentinus]KAB3531540.1 type I glutamate--ammonia ligase [Alkaliphilus serpentinus]
MFTTFGQVKEYCNEKQIKMIDFKMIDLFGRWRHLTIPVDRFTEETLIMGIGFDGSNYGFAPVEKSDMVFIPDLSTGIMDPFAKIPTLSILGDVYVTGDTPKPFEQDPRAVANRAEEYMKSTGIADLMKTGPEFEFYVFDHISYETRPNSVGFRVDSQQAEWNSSNLDDNKGYKVPLKGGYHITPPMDILYDLRSEMCLLLEERGVEVKYHHPEVGGPGQMEIEVEPGAMREMADKTMLIKYVVKNAAFNAGKSATFMPKPLFGEAGNGLHVHMHLFKDGEPIFYDADGYSGLSQTALYFIGGLLKNAPALCGLTNPSTNSYKRLVPGYEAPVSICYATANRSAVIRIPDYAKTPDQKRFEIRNPDATCNPYYAFAAILMAGLDGIENKLDPVEHGYGPYDINLYNLPKEEQSKIKPLPKSLEEALDALEADHEFLLKGNVFSKRLIEIWIENKRKELKEFSKIPHPAEFGLYYDL